MYETKNYKYVTAISIRCLLFSLYHIRIYYDSPLNCYLEIIKQMIQMYNTVRIFTKIVKKTKHL